MVAVQLCALSSKAGQHAEALDEARGARVARGGGGGWWGVVGWVVGGFFMGFLGS